MRNLEEYNQRFAGKKALILGSGTSLSKHLLFLKSIPDDWVSFAVNSAYIACETDFFVSDDIDIQNWSFFAYDLRNSQKTQVLLYEDKLGDRAEWFGERSVLYRHRRHYHITPKYSHTDKENHLFQCRSSLGSCIHIAHIMGCSEILILGLDCYREGKFRWFWQFPDWPNKPYRIDGKRIDKYHRRRTLQINTDSDLADILLYWKTKGSQINEKCKVYNGSEKSLIDVFPYMGLNEFRNYVREDTSCNSSERRVERSPS